MGGFHAVPGCCRGLQGLAGASKGLQGPPGAFGGSRDLGLEPWARLKFHAGWSGWTRPPTMARGRGGRVSATKSRGGFLRDLNALRLDASANIIWARLNDGLYRE